MRPDIPAEEPQRVWLSQPTEMQTMTLKLMQRRLRDVRTKTRKKLIGTFAGPAATGLFYALGMRVFGPVGDVVQPAFVFAFAWSLIGLYFLNRGMWSAERPGDAGLSTGLEFCRRELGRQRDLVGRVLLWSFGPVLLAIVGFLVALALVSKKEKGLFPNGLPFLIGVVVWIVSFFVMRLRDQRALQMEIDELDEMKREDVEG